MEDSNYDQRWLSNYRPQKSCTHFWVGAVHDGIYDKIEGTRKAILLSGIVVDTVEYHDTYIFPTVNGTNFVAVVGTNPTTNETITVNIQDNDVVTFTKANSPD